MNRMRNVFLFVAMVFLLTGCAAKPVQKNWTATGGSRADATVDVSYEYIIEKEQPVLNQEQANDLAAERCKAWGYSSAESFGGETVNRSPAGQDILIGQLTMARVTRTYQCLGKGDSKTEKK